MPKHNKVLICAVVCLLAFGSRLAFAAGTPVSTIISNTATLDYSVSGVPQNIITSPATSFVVDNKINLSVAEKTGNPSLVVPGQLAAVTTFTVTNNGNAVQDYALTGGNVISAPTVFGIADTFDATACNTFVETDGAPGYTAGADTATFIDELAPDATKDVYVVCNIAAAAISDTQAVIELKAFTGAGGTAGTQGAALVETAGADDTALVDIVFADPVTIANASGTVPAQIARDANAFARAAYRVAAVVTKVTKTATCKLTPTGISTVANCANAKTGTIITYQIKVDVTGAGIAQQLYITDPIPSDLIYTPNSITVGASPRTDALDADNVQFTTVALPVVVATQQPAVPANTAIISFGNVAVTAATPKTFIITLNTTIK